MHSKCYVRSHVIGKVSEFSNESCKGITSVSFITIRIRYELDIGIKWCCYAIDFAETLVFEDGFDVYFLRYGDIIVGLGDFDAYNFGRLSEVCNFPLSA